METILLFTLVSWSLFKTMACSSFSVPRHCNNWLCTSLDVEAGYLYIPYLKKIKLSTSCLSMHCKKIESYRFLQNDMELMLGL
jgi:hypothetical protein